MSKRTGLPRPTTAIENIRINAQSNNLKINVFKSDLFEKIPQRIFDYVIINPPYFNKDPQKEAEYAWNCGSNFEYFHSLFKSLRHYINSNSSVFMVLSDACKLDKIKSIGIEYCFEWKLVLQKRIWSEENYIYRITLYDF